MVSFKGDWESKCLLFVGFLWYKDGFCCKVVRGVRYWKDKKVIFNKVCF